MSSNVSKFLNQQHAVDIKLRFLSLTHDTAIIVPSVLSPLAPTVVDPALVHLGVVAVSVGVAVPLHVHTQAEVAAVDFLGCSTGCKRLLRLYVL